jgi:hypothetical protein
MRRFTREILIGLAALLLTACADNPNSKAAKTVTPPAPAVARAATAPPERLSIPQTQVALPTPQPVSPEALAQAAAAPVLEMPESTAPKQPSRPSSSRSTAPVVRSAAPEPVVTPAPPPEPQRPIVQEQIPPAEQKRLTELIATRKREIGLRLDAVAARGATSDEASLVNRIRSFLDLSDKAAQRGDLRQADALAERAQILSRELQGAH